MIEKACENCGRIVEGPQVCPNCGESSFSESWKGYAIVIDPGVSKVAKRMGVDTPGRYALDSQRGASRGT